MSSNLPCGRFLIAAVVVLAVVLMPACSGPTLEECLSTPIDSMTEQDIAGCWALAKELRASPSSDLQNSGRAVQIRIPAQLVPTATPTPPPISVDVGFLSFETRRRTEDYHPSETIWYTVYNSAGTTKRVDANLVSGKDSGGNEHGPYWLPSRDFMGNEPYLVIRENAARNCWRWISFTGPFSLRPGAKGCVVGFVYYMVEPNTTIKEVHYDGKKLPLPPRSRTIS